MPSSITHAYIGLDTMNKLNDKPQKIIKNHLNNYKVYCQSMDVLYFYHILRLIDNPIIKVGHTFHNQNVYATFKTLIDDNKKNKDKELFTFIAGLITHYQADSIMHPYINYLSHNKTRIKTIDKHFEIETYIDNYFIRERLTKNYSKNNHSKFLFNYTKEDIIKEEITKIFNKYYHIDHVGKYYYQALKEMQFVFNYLRYDSLGLKKVFYQIIDLNPFSIRRTKYLSYHFTLDNDTYYLNLDHKTWFNYRKKDLTFQKDFLTLYDEVIKNASKIINHLYDYIFDDKDIDLKNLIKNISYSTGLPL